jgi:hypothetical protein
LLHGLCDSRNLRHDVAAFTFFFKHVLDSPNLALNTTKSLLKINDDVGIYLHDSLSLAGAEPTATTFWTRR